MEKFVFLYILLDNAIWLAPAPLGPPLRPRWNLPFILRPKGV